MNIRDYASDFMIYVLSGDADLGARVKLALSQAKYDTYFFADSGELHERIKDNPPHTIVVDAGSIDKTFEIADAATKEFLKFNKKIKLRL